MIALAIFASPVKAVAQTAFGYDSLGNLTVVSNVVATLPPAFQFTPAYLCTESNGLLSVSAPVTGVGPFTYQWLLNGIAIPGATNDSFQLPNAATNNLGNYQLVVANSSGAVTSAVINVSFDSDHNGLPDAWEIAYFGHIGVNPNADADGDGISNYVEWLDGTNPTNSSSLKPRLNLSGTPGGSVSVSPLQAKYDLNASVQLTAQPDPGQSFIGWFGSITSTSNPLNLVMNSSKSVTGLFGLPLADALDTTNLAWSAGGDLGWFGQSVTTHDGVDAAQSGPILASQQSWVQTTITNSARSVLRFWWRVSSYSGNDYLQLYVNGVLLTSLTGESGWLFQSYYLPPGTNTFKWVYAKGPANGQYNLSQDAAWLDQVEVIPFENLYAWLDNSSGQSTVPPGLTNLVAIAAGGFHSLALKTDGTGAAWGDDSYGQIEVPAGLTNVVAIAGGGSHSLALKGDGTVIGWGDTTQGATAVPAGLSNVVAISAGWEHSLALKSDGTVAAWGNNRWRQATVPPGLSNVVAVAAGWGHTLALNSDGTVAVWGYNGDHETNVPSGLTGVVAIASGWDHCLALRGDGTVVAWGSNSDGQTNVPSGLTGVAALAGGGDHSLALKNDGTVAGWGDDSYGQIDVPSGLTNVVAIAAGGFHSLALVDGGPPVIARQPFCQTTSAGTTVTLAVTTITSPPLSYQWRLNGTNIVGATNATLTLTNVQAPNAGSYSVLVSNPRGSVTSSTALLAINPAAPTIVAQPSNQNVFFADGATLTVAARGTEPLAYQWQFNGANIDNATNATLTWTNVQPANVGNYVVVVSNSVGHVTSQVVALMATPPPVCVTRPPGLVAWWPGDGFALDVVGTNHGILQSGGGFALGESGQGFDFEAAKANLMIPYSADLLPTTYSIQAWIKPFGQPAGGWAMVFGQRNGRGLEVVRGSNGGVTAELEEMSQTGSWTYLMTGGEFPLNQFTHVIATWDGAAAKLYANGVLSAQGSLAAPFSQPTCPFFIGGVNYSGSGCGSYDDGYFNGVIDEVAVWNRALSVSEVSTIYSAGRAGLCFTNDSAPVFIQRPVSQTAYVGGTVTLTGAAMGSPRPTYQWRFNGGAISGATSVALTLTSLTVADAGIYTLVASNTAGVNESQGASLSIEPCLTRPSGLVAWWPGDGFAFDVVGSNHGTLQNGAVYGLGKVGEAFSLDGVDDSISFGGQAGNFGTNDFTVFLWLRTTAMRSDEVVLSKRVYCGDCSFWNIAVVFGKISVEVDQNTAGQNYLSLTASTMVNDGGFHHVAYTRRSTNCSIFIDGVLAATGTTAGITSLSNSAALVAGYGVCIGAGVGANYFTGQLDEVGIVSRALSSEEIGSIYAAGRAGMCFTNDPVPFCVQQPVSQTGYVGSMASLSAAVMGTPRPTYQWWFKGNPLLGATNATFTLTNLTLADAGTYTLVASNTAGALESQPATLSVQPCLPRPSGLAAWWPADGFALDLAGTNNGTLQNGATYVPGKVGQAFTFNGSGAFISVANTATMDFGRGDFSIAVWIRLASLGYDQEIIQKSVGTYPNEQAYFLEFDTPNGLRFVLRDSSANQNDLSVPTQLMTGSWYLVAGVRSGNTNQLYLNGNLIGSQVSGSNANTGAGGIARIGRLAPNPSNIDRYFWGDMDELSLYNRALSASEISTIYAAGSAGVCFTNTPAPVFVQQPVSQAGYVGGTVTLTGAAMGTPRPTYQWRFNGDPIPGATNATLAVINLVQTNAGVYTIVASNTVGTLESQPATLAIGLADSQRQFSGTQGSNGWYYGYYDGTSATPFTTGDFKELPIFVSGTWARNSLPGRWDTQLWQDGGHPNGGGEVNWAVRRWASGVSGVVIISCTLADSDGGGGNGVIGHTILDGTEISSRTIENGNSAGISYQTNARVLVGSLLDFAIDPRNGDSYFDSTRFTMVIVPGIVIQAQPQGQTNAVGSTGTFSVTATGIAPLAYQWLFNGTNLPAATNVSLTLLGVTLSDAGRYQVLVTNSYGSCTSVTASLTLLPPTLTFDTSPSGLQFSNGVFGLRLNGLTAHGPVVIYTSTNLMGWDPIFTSPPVNGILQFLDTSATNWPMRFYRAREQ
jgi:hypothetical protein